MIAGAVAVAILTQAPMDAAKCHRDGGRYNAFSVSSTTPCLTSAERLSIVHIVKRAQPWQKDELAFSFARANGVGPLTVVVYDSYNTPLDGHVPRQPSVHAMFPALNLPGLYFDPAHHAVVKDAKNVPK